MGDAVGERLPNSPTKPLDGDRGGVIGGEDLSLQALIMRILATPDINKEGLKALSTTYYFESANMIIRELTCANGVPESG